MSDMQKVEFTPIQHTEFPKRVKIKFLLWHTINMTIFRYSPFFCRKFRVLLLRLFGAKIDWSCSISRLAEIDGPWFLTMGYRSSLADGVWISCLAPVTIGKHCIIGRGVSITTGSHRLSSPRFELVTAPVTIHDNAWLATRSFVHKGCIVGEGAVVGACSVVSGEIAPWAVVCGNPAKFVKKRELDLCIDVKT